MVSGAKAVTEVAFDQGPFFEVTQKGLSLDQLAISWASGSEVISGGGNVQYMERTGYTEGTLEFSIGENPVSLSHIFGDGSVSVLPSAGKKGVNTIDSTILIGGPGWAVDLFDVVSAWDVNGEGSHNFFPHVGGIDIAEFKDADLFDVGLNFNIPALYWGDKAEELHRHRNDGEVWAALLDTNGRMFHQAHVSMMNMPRTQPVNSRIINDLTLNLNGPYYSNAGHVARVNAGAVTATKSVTITGTAAGDNVTLYVTKYPGGIAAADVTGGPDDVEVAGVGVYNLGKVADDAAGNMTLTFAHATTADAKIEGYVLVGPEWDPDSEGSGFKHGHNMRVKNYPLTRASGGYIENWEGRVILTHNAGSESRRRIAVSQGINGPITVTDIP